MKKVSRFHLLLAVVILMPLGDPVRGATLKPEANRAFDDYTRRIEAVLDRELATGVVSLWAGGRLAELSNRNVLIEGWQGKPRIEAAGDSLIHDWIAAGFAPGVSLEQVVAILRDYDRHARVYAPEILRSKVISHQGDAYQTQVRLMKKKILTVVLDATYSVGWRQPKAGEWQIRIVSKEIREVENPGAPDEHVEPYGEGNGFLWRLNSYWKLEQRENGTYLECRAVSLTRSIPFGLSNIIGPIVSSLPRESLEKTVRTTLEAAARN